VYKLQSVIYKINYLILRILLSSFVLLNTKVVFCPYTRSYITILTYLTALAIKSVLAPNKSMIEKLLVKDLTYYQLLNKLVCRPNREASYKERPLDIIAQKN